jgi:RNA polymerase sigma-54 factor
VLRGRADGPVSLAPRLELRQTQALVMTPQLQQAIKLLQMSNLELADYVAGLIEANPLLEEVRPVPRGPVPAGGEGPDAIEFAAAPVTLRGHLLAQIGMAAAPRPAVAAAVVLVDELDADGYLRVPLAEVADRHGFRGEAVAAGLALVQACEPAGVGARGLAECLGLQLRERGLLDEAMVRLLEGLPLLAAGRQGELAVRCGVTAATLGEMLAVVRGLDPRPGARFGEEAVPVAVPDVFVHRRATGWEVELNSETLPRVLVNNAYALEIEGADGAARSFISECSAQANWLVRSLEQRARTILKVAGEIVRHQERFFAEGVAGLRPLSQRALADRIGMHESTVSRVTASKYLACQRGTFELRFFFSQSIQATEGGEAFSSTAVQDRIRSLIQAERPPRTLSDDKIVVLLQGEGIDIARRTVAKYRELMGIPSSVSRRRLKSEPLRA